MVALDGSADALVALEYVSCLPLTSDDMVVLVSVAEKEPIPASHYRRQYGRDLRVLLQESWAAKRAGALRTVESGQTRLGEWQTPVSQIVRSGHPVKVLSGLTQELAADLLIVGPRGRGQFASLLLGSVTQSLLGLSYCPVLVARQPVGAPRRVVLAVDGSLHAAAATRTLATFPLAGDATVDVIAVAMPWSPPDDGIAPGGWPELSAAGKEVARGLATGAAETLTAAGVNTKISIRAGDPGREIIAAARAIHADLVVVGSRGRGGMRGLLLGSVSRRVAATAPCSVLVVPTQRGRSRTDRDPQASTLV